MNSLNAYTIDQARKIGNSLGVDWGTVDIQEFMMGLGVEREHGLVNDITNITNDNDLVTGKIVWAHLKEMPDYYTKLAQMERGSLPEPDIPYHYYGDRVRQVYFVAAAIMLIGLPFVAEFVAMPVFISILAILILDFLAGLTNPRQLWVNWSNTIVSAVALVVFELAAVKSLTDSRLLLFVVNQLLAVLFLFAIYYNTKTLRAMLLK